MSLFAAHSHVRIFIGETANREYVNNDSERIPSSPVGFSQPQLRPAPLPGCRDHAARYGEHIIGFLCGYVFLSGMHSRREAACCKSMACLSLAGVNKGCPRIDVRRRDRMHSA